MAQKIMLIDDLDGESAAEMTLKFGLDGQDYEIDLNDENYEKYRSALELLSANGRQVENIVSKKRTLSTGKKSGVVGKTQHIREWARQNGFPNLSDRGRIPQPIMDAYETRSRVPEKAVEAPVVAPEVTTPVDEDKAAEEAVIARVKNTPKPADKKPTTRGRTVKKTELPELRQALSLVGGDE